MAVLSHFYTQIHLSVMPADNLRSVFMSSDHTATVKQAPPVPTQNGLQGHKQTRKGNSYVPFIRRAHAKPTQKGQPKTGSEPTTFVPAWETTFTAFQSCSAWNSGLFFGPMKVARTVGILPGQTPVNGCVFVTKPQHNSTSMCASLFEANICARTRDELPTHDIMWSIVRTNEQGSKSNIY